MSATSVLIVDDSPVNLKLMRLLVTAAGYAVWTAQDAEEAFAVLQTLKPRLILMDVQLPGMDGLELTRRLKADPATRGIVIIAITANAMKADEHAALAAGCDGFIAKPINTRTLPAVLSGYLTGDFGREGPAHETTGDPGR